ncbi:MAG: hypothetical protein COA89_15850 [Acidithiobacillus sp.]|jgi:hypothetical protein|nr:MAG: hypothetical protein COA89_15850 [Acidithiobacillus sp.]
MHSDFADGACEGCGEPRVAMGYTPILFSAVELAGVEKILEDQCFPCWKYANLLPARIAKLDDQLRKLRKKYPGKVARIPKGRRFGEA